MAYNMMTLNGMFANPKPHRINFIKENKKKLKEISNMVNQNNKSRFDLNKNWKNSQTEISQTASGSLTGMKENRNYTSSSSRLSCKGSMAVFLNEKKDRGNSNVSLSLKQKSSQKVVTQKNQACQTIDPRRCDQLFHEGIIKYPSNKVLQELEEIEKQKANRLDAHVRKEFFKRNKLKIKSPTKLFCPDVMNIKLSGKGDEKDKSVSDGEVAEEEEDEKEPDKETEPSEETQSKKQERKQPNPPLTMSAAEIIRRTTQNMNNQRGNSHVNHFPNNKGDARVQKKHLKKAALSKDEIVDPQCPPGHIPLPDVERKKTLHMLRVSHAELVREMNLLPVRTDTLRIRQRKIQLENQLNKIEEGIKVFTKSKVYVKIEE